MKFSKAALVVSLALVVINGVYLFIDPVPQWPSYHCFADDRSWLGLSNAQNVLSNLGLFIVGAWGCLFVVSRRGRVVAGRVWPQYTVFFLGVFLTAFGSAWYHYAPDNHTLVWDRLPMTVMFMGFLTVFVGELMDHKAADTLLLPLLLTGFASVILWIQSEMAGAGDLRFYALVQFLPLVLALLMLLLYPKPPHLVAAFIGLLVFFVLAKVFEHYDQEVFVLTNSVIGGHAIKHFCAAIAPGFLVWMLYRRGRALAVLT
jgi:hypothetical protein